MKNYIYYFVTLFLLSAGNLLAQEHIKFNPKYPQPGQTIQITYNTDSTVLDGKKSIHGVAYLFVNYSWHPIDLVCTANGNIWNASIVAPKNCGIIAFKFFAGDTVDNNNDKCYAIMLTDSTHQPAAGGCAGWALLRSPQYNLSVPNYFNGDAISDTAAYYWLNKEITLHPAEGKSKLALPYASVLKNAHIDGANEQILRIVKFLTKDSATEKDLLSAMSIEAYTLNNTSVADSLNALILQRYPKGSLAMQIAYRKVFTDQDLNKAHSSFKTFLANYPEEQTDKKFLRDHALEYDKLYSNMIIIGILNNDYTLFDRYLNNLSYLGLLDIYHKMIEIPHDRKDKTDEQLYTYDDKIIKKMEQMGDQQPNVLWYLSDVEWKEYYKYAFAQNALRVHINILKNLGKYDDALKYAEFAEDILKYKSAPHNNDYAYLLQRKSDTLKLHDVLIKSMYQNQASPEMITMLKVDYVKQYKTEDGFEAYLQSLKNATAGKAKLSAIKADMVKMKLPDWSMYDMNGKLVSLKDLRGKIVVMDFWATWCVPCKASFPGMKLAVEKYKKDPNVVFYFVDTEEYSADYKAQVKKYLKDNNYAFNALFDNKEKNGKYTGEVYKVMCKYLHTSGIPFKLFIDKEGYLRYSTSGNPPSASEIADEVSDIIEMVKNAE